MEEAFRVTIQAFNAAEESRSPVVILSDTFVAHLNEVVDLDELAAERAGGRAQHRRRSAATSPGIRASSPAC